MAPISDERLFSSYRDGDSDALRTLVDRHHDDLMRFLYRMTGDRQLAEDAFQDAFLQIHQSAGTFDTSRSFRPWLFTVAANKARDLLRKKGRRRMVPLSAPIGGGSDGDGRQSSFIDLIEVESDGPGDRLNDSERDALVQRAVDALSPTLREILLLAYFQRLSYAQIADDLGIPLGTVKSRLHAAVASFAKHWRTLNHAQNADNTLAQSTDAEPDTRQEGDR
ncbi:MAG: RNA polymerase sigma factor [Planctomycetota bacterium]